MIRINDARLILEQAGYDIRNCAASASSNGRNGGCGAPTFRVYKPGSDCNGHQVMTLKQLRQLAASCIAQ